MSSSEIVFPKNTPECLYIYSNASLSEIIEASRSHFGEDIDLDRLQIGAEYHQVSCFGYDLYDASDYASFICVTLDQRIDINKNLA